MLKSAAEFKKIKQQYESSIEKLEMKASEKRIINKKIKNAYIAMRESLANHKKGVMNETDIESTEKNYYAILQDVAFFENLSPLLKINFYFQAAEIFYEWHFYEFAFPYYTKARYEVSQLNLDDNEVAKEEILAPLHKMLNYRLNQVSIEKSLDLLQATLRQQMLKYEELKYENLKYEDLTDAEKNYFKDQLLHYQNQLTSFISYVITDQEDYEAIIRRKKWLPFIDEIEKYEKLSAEKCRELLKSWLAQPSTSAKKLEHDSNFITVDLTFHLFEMRQNAVLQFTKKRDAKNWVELFREYNTSTLQLVREIAQQTMFLMGKPPCDVCLLGGGSLARGEMQLDSDIDCALLIAEAKYRDHPYFANYIRLFDFFIKCAGGAWQLTLDGENVREKSWAKKLQGLQLDSGNLARLTRTNTENILLNTPEVMAQWVLQSISSSQGENTVYAMELQYALLLFANHADAGKLWQQYQRTLMIGMHFLSPTLEDKAQPFAHYHQLALAYLQSNVEANAVKDFQFSNSLTSANLKEGFIKLFVLLTLKLGLYFGMIKEEKTQISIFPAIKTDNNNDLANKINSNQSKDKNSSNLFTFLSNVSAIWQALNERQIISSSVATAMQSGWNYLQELRYELNQEEQTVKLNEKLVENVNKERHLLLFTIQQLLLKPLLHLTNKGLTLIEHPFELYWHNQLTELNRSFALSNFSLEEITHLKKCVEDKVGKDDNLDEKIIQKIQAISLTNSDWTKIEFEQGEVKRLKQFLVEKQEKKLIAKLLLKTEEKIAEYNELIQSLQTAAHSSDAISKQLCANLQLVFDCSAAVRFFMTLSLSQIFSLPHYKQTNEDIETLQLSFSQAPFDKIKVNLITCYWKNSWLYLKEQADKDPGIWLLSIITTSDPYLRLLQTGIKLYSPNFSTAWENVWQVLSPKTNQNTPLKNISNPLPPESIINCVNLIRYFTDKKQVYLLAPQWVNNWFDLQGKLKKGEAFEYSATRRIVNASGRLTLSDYTLHPGVHFKKDPEFPGREYASRHFWHYLTGEKSAPMELIEVQVKFKEGSKVAETSYLVLLTETIDGPALDTVMNQAMLLEGLDKRHFFWRILHSILLMAEDGKGNNQKIINTATGKQIISFDDDHIIVDGVTSSNAWQKLRDSRSNEFIKDYRVQAKQALYCLQEAAEKIDKAFIREFISQWSPSLFLLMLNLWIKDLEINYQQRYQKLFSDKRQQLYENFLQEKENASLMDLLFRDNTLAEIYDRFLRIYRYFQQVYNDADENPTYLDLLVEIEPILGTICVIAHRENATPKLRFDYIENGQYIRSPSSTSNNGDKKENLITGLGSKLRLQAMYGAGPAKLKELMEINSITVSELFNEHKKLQQQEQNKNELIERLYQAQEITTAVVDEYVKLLTDAPCSYFKEELLEKIFYNKLTLEQQEQMIELVSNVLSKLKHQTVKHLTFKGCETLTGIQLSKILAQCPQLVDLHLEACPLIDELSALKQCKKIVRIKAINLKNLKKLDLTDEYENLDILDLTGCHQVETIRLYAPSLRKLIINQCKELKLLDIHSYVLTRLEYSDTTSLNAEQLIKAASPIGWTQVKTVVAQHASALIASVNNENCHSLNYSNNVYSFLAASKDKFRYGYYYYIYKNLSHCFYQPNIMLEFEGNLADEVIEGYPSFNKKIIKAIAENSQRQSLVCCKVKQPILLAVLQYLTNDNCITSLKIQKDILDDKVMLALANLIGINKCLEKIMIEECDYEITRLPEVIRALKANNFVEFSIETGFKGYKDDKTPKIILANKKTKLAIKNELDDDDISKEIENINFNSLLFSFKKLGDRKIYFQPEMDNFYSLKVVLVGPSKGKSALLKRYTDNSFSDVTDATESIVFKNKIIEFSGKEIKLRIWDLEGWDEVYFIKLIEALLSSAKAFMLSLDVTNDKAFEGLRHYISIINSLYPDIPRLLVGTVCDLEEQRIIDPEQALAFAKEIGAFAYIETSAKTNFNVEEAFLMVAKKGLEYALPLLAFMPDNKISTVIMLSRLNKKPSLLKMVIIGLHGCGTTSLIRQFANNTFVTPGPRSTIGVGFETSYITIEGVRIKLQIWGPPGTEKVWSITASYLREAAAVILLIDLTNQHTIKHMRNYWESKLAKSIYSHMPYLLVGTKLDIVKHRAINFEEGKNFANEIGAMTYIETSAMTGENVDKAFHLIAKEGLQYIQGKHKPKAMQLTLPSDINSSQNKDQETNTFYLLKIALMGPYKGKSSLLNRYTENSFSYATNPTLGLGVEFRNKIIKMADKEIKLQILDMGSYEYFRPIGRSYFISAKVLMLSLDVTNDKAFEGLRHHIDIIKSLCPDIPRLLVGTVCDLKEYRVINLEEAQAFAKEIGAFAYIETSAKTNVNVEEAFLMAAKKGLEYASSFDNRIKLSDNPQGIFYQTPFTPNQSQSQSNSAVQAKNEEKPIDPNERDYAKEFGHN